MSLLSVVVVLILIGLLLYAVNAFVPMDAKIKQILNVVVVIATVLWLVSLWLPIGAINQVRVGR